MLELETWVSGSILTGGNILLLFFFCFHVVKPLMPILALLPMLCACENREYTSVKLALVPCNILLVLFVRAEEFCMTNMRNMQTCKV